MENINNATQIIPLRRSGTYYQTIIIYHYEGYLSLNNNVYIYCDINLRLKFCGKDILMIVENIQKYIK